MAALTGGFLAGITRLVVKDKDLDLQIRADSINIYYKGSSLLRLAQKSEAVYQAHIHAKFLEGCQVPDTLTDAASADRFLAAVPALKENIIKYGKSSLEVEYEQLIIRANNYEPRNATEYFIVDRQYVSGKEGRFDLTGFYWNRNKRRKGQTVPLCLMEVKFALNADIQRVDEQLSRYYQAIQADFTAMAEEVEGILKQKLALGLFDQPPNRLEAMQTLSISRELDDCHFILFLIDYNPFSRHLHKEKLASLSFAKQIRIFHGGFALWETALEKIGEG